MSHHCHYDILCLSFHHGTQKTCPMMVTDSEASQHRPEAERSDIQGCMQPNPTRSTIFTHQTPNGDRQWSLLEHITDARSTSTLFKKTTILMWEESYDHPLYSPDSQAPTPLVMSLEERPKRSGQPSTHCSSTPVLPRPYLDLPRILDGWTHLSKIGPL
jgi:hypothetical protein